MYMSCSESTWHVGREVRGSGGWVCGWRHLLAFRRCVAGALASFSSSVPTLGTFEDMLKVKNVVLRDEDENAQE